MGRSRILLRCLNRGLEGKSWESERSLCIGRSLEVEVALPDSSLSRRHAEIALTDGGWVVRDLGSKNGTFVNGIRVGQVDRPLHSRDVLQCGNIILVPILAEEEPAAAGPEGDTLAEHWQVQGTARHSWEEAVQRLALDVTRRVQPGEQLVTLLRAGQHLHQVSSPDELMRLSLRDVVAATKARRGAVLLADPGTGRLAVRATCVPDAAPSDERPFSRTLAERCYRLGESVLCNDVRNDPELLRTQSVTRSSMCSIVCALLRTPRGRLGVLHLDRGPAEPPFTVEDLNLADGLAAGLSANVAGVQLLYEKQRNIFVQTVIALTQTLGLRDPRTAGHSQRVTDYALLLADELDLAAAERQRLLVAAPVHDIGKIGVSDAVLRKAGDLNHAEFEQMKAHSANGAALLGAIPDLADVVPIVRGHHERWDGQGYPDGLAGAAIPPLARLIAVADTFDDLTSDTPYRPGVSADTALEQIQEGAGTQFDPDHARALRGCGPRLRQLLQRRTAPDREPAAT